MLSWYSEKDMFIDIWNSVSHRCEVCGKMISEPQSWCFAHMLPKGMYPKWRLERNNISLVCSIDCHMLVDKYCTWNKMIIEKSLENGKKISIKDICNLNSL